MDFFIDYRPFRALKSTKLFHFQKIIAMLTEKYIPVIIF